LWRGWALFIAGLGGLVGLVWAVSLPFTRRSGSLRLCGVETGASTPWHLLLPLAAGVGLFSFWVLRVLYRESVRAQFSGRGREAGSWWLVVATLSLAICTVALVGAHSIVCMLRSLECREATVVVTDAESGDVLDAHIGTGGRTLGQLFPRVGVSSGQKSGGPPCWHVEWLSPNPITVSFTAPGHHMETVTLDEDDNHETVTAPLTREEP
ncbi:hypothetical protein HQ560_08495, partial [bacterium]|nr:hypothetical protein [bacterium]